MWSQVCLIGALLVFQSSGQLSEENSPDAIACAQCSQDQWKKLKTELKEELVEAVKAAVNESGYMVEECMELHHEELIRRTHLGETSTYPAWSCNEIAQKKPTSASGYYWVQSCKSSYPAQVYCDLEKMFYGTKGWMRVANLDMNDPQQNCPSAFRVITTGGKRLCGKKTDANGNYCNSVTFTSYGHEYQRVCGRVVGYQWGSPDAFYRYDCDPCTVDDSYVDGISITHGTSPRKHIWTYVSAIYETSTACPCSTGSSRTVPGFVGGDYYCEASLYGAPWRAQLYASDALWDGLGCHGVEGPCCTSPSMPWFCTELPASTTDSLEVRICTDQTLGDEDMPIEVVELYVM